ncbi:hypothetical protein CaldiYA01_23600 [Caldicellulosiruptor diazotrophicus]|uniref:Uncharacterized protein n=1 Tax=Caldicellulosiruptor diazotrophicus TaxID=2806205 RepID=A0ABM7NQG1_9FIRM|nr:hypothetical protein CaldiYA01_23600 [Caldicellulosiruptor diazotrophicus]
MKFLRPLKIWLSNKLCIASCDGSICPALKQLKVKFARLLYVIGKKSSLAKNEKDKGNGFY